MSIIHAKSVSEIEPAAVTLVMCVGWGAGSTQARRAALSAASGGSAPLTPQEQHNRNHFPEA